MFLRTTRSHLALCSIFFLSLSQSQAASSESYPFKKPKLVLTLVVDQFRADYLTRFKSRFLPAHGKNGAVGGYAYLMNEGAYFPFAEYNVLQAMTGPGHSIILSGSEPYLTGIPLNNWFDSATGQAGYCVSDPKEALVGAKGPGISPRNFQGTTVGDELKNAGFHSRIDAVSLKDRAAVLLGGHRADLALWFDTASYQWISSHYYVPSGTLPDWVKHLNEKTSTQKGETFTWTAEGKATELSLPSPGEFKHIAASGGRELLSTPFGLQITREAAESAILNDHLGRGEDTDMLSVSFSTHDILGHLYGPNTLEMEEITVAEDREISKLLTYINGKVTGGLENVVIVLTGDHGTPPGPAWAKSVGIDAGKLNGEDLVSLLEKGLTEKFGTPSKGNWVLHEVDFNFYLSRETKLSPDVVEEEAKRILSKETGVFQVVTEADYRARKLPPGIIGRQVLKTFYPGKSGDVILIPRPFWMEEGDPVDHMTNYTYDITVPLILKGSHLKAGVYATHAEVIDIAPTLSFLLGILSPSLSEGRVLSEAIDPSSGKR
jgi:predicted AlkP superfamily pyrophosphatase or phosphodiesterase